MARIASFRGYRFNPSEVGDLNKVVTQPYDKIDDKLRDEYLSRSEYSVVRIIRGPPKPDDNPNDNVYTRAADYWTRWIEDRVLIREPGPAIYPCFEEFTVDGETFIRKGLVTLVCLDDDKSTVRAHEKTLSGPKADRLRLMRATEANDGQIFMLYDDPDHRINNLIDEESAMAQPIMTVKDDYDAVHRLYRISRPGLIQDVSEAFEDLELFIADGHHRYETAVEYMDECKGRYWKPMGAETFNYRMMTLVNMHDPGLTVLPTHRVLHSLEGFAPRGVLESAAEYFDITEYADRPSLYAALDESGKAGRTAFGFSAEGSSGLRLLTLKDPAIVGRLVEVERSETWRRLDVTVLHVVLLEKILGLDADKMSPETNVHYVRGRDEALDMVGCEGCQAAFLVNPTLVQQVREVALAGERMPQKSTDFFPKLLTGMVMMKMTIDKSAGLAVWEADKV